MKKESDDVVVGKKKTSWESVTDNKTFMTLVRSKEGVLRVLEIPKL